MNERRLNGLRVAVVATDGVEHVELVELRKALDEAGAQTQLISIHGGQIQSVNHDKPAAQLPVDHTIDQVTPDQFDALLLPGGVMSPDQLRMDPRAVQFVKSIFTAGKPVAAICHGPWLLVEAGVVAGKTLTSWPSLQTDIRNAGGNWVDQQVAQDGNLVTSRNPDDIPAFNQKVLELFATARQSAAAGSR